MLQVFTNHAELIIENVIPGWDVMKSLSRHAGWPRDSYALIKNRESLITFWFLWVVPDPYGLRDEDDADSDDPRWQKWLNFTKVARQFEDNWQCKSPADGYRFIETCIEAGYNIEQHGSRITFWVVHRIAIALAQVEAIQMDTEKHQGVTYEDYPSVDEFSMDHGIPWLQLHPGDDLTTHE